MRHTVCWMPCTEHFIPKRNRGLPALQLSRSLPHVYLVSTVLPVCSVHVYMCEADLSLFVQEEIPIKYVLYYLSFIYHSFKHRYDLVLFYEFLPCSVNMSFLTWSIGHIDTDKHWEKQGIYVDFAPDMRLCSHGQYRSKGRKKSRLVKRSSFITRCEYRFKSRIMICTCYET